ncbi:LysE family translocator [Streptomyces sp. NPDC057638]|uniref:LysE family translocator n=1 Tax=Streptomyces sp. NPDC057638 TaxID=3346190 RepID=UPI0036C040DC
MEWHQVLGFTAAVIPLTLTPGTSFTLVTQRVINGSRRDGVLVALGTACGLLVHAAFAAVGLSALVMSSAWALTAVQILGGVYLVWLGVTTWRSARRDPAGAGPPARGAGLGGFRQGFWANVTNPRAVTVYLTLVPQFLTPGRPVAPQIAALVAAHVVVLLGWLLFCASVISAARGVLDTPGFRRGMSRVAGVVLVGLGIRMALGS